MEHSELKREDRTLVTLKWLMIKFPKAFLKKHPKPLKKGIREEIFDHLPDLISKAMLKRALLVYTRSKAYQKGLLLNTHRIDLKGNIAEEISADEKAQAKPGRNKKADSK